MDKKNIMMNKLTILGKRDIVITMIIDNLESCNEFRLLYGDGIRIGLEDNLYCADKVKTSNIDLLKRIHNIMNDLCIQKMTPQEFIDLGYVNKKNNHTR